MLCVARQTIGRRAVLALDGELDIATVTMLADLVQQVVDDGAAELWIDLTGTTFMDSSGVHLLVDTHHQLGALNRRLAVICDHGPVRRLFEATGAEALLSVYDSRSAANGAG